MFLRHKVFTSPIRCTLLGLVLLFFTVTLLAEAFAFFSLSHFSFARPASWEWVDTPNRPNMVIMNITDAELGTAKITMIHYLPSDGLGKRSSALRRWNELFLPVPERQSSTNDVRIGLHIVTFVKVNGALKPEKPGEESHPDSELLGAIIADDSGNVLAKFVGPAKVVEKFKDAFQRLIESGPQQEQ